MHGCRTTPDLANTPAAQDPRARRIAELSAEYLCASKERRRAIDDEIGALIAGSVSVFPIYGV